MIIDELIANTVNDRIFTIVDRANLALIQQEADFQMSGEVSDENAVSIGQKLGAQTIVSGTIVKIGNLYRLRVRSLDVETAQIQGQFNSNIPNSNTVQLLAESKSIGVSVGNNITSSNKENANVTIIRNTPSYKIGGEGPAGGIIFYDKGDNIGGWCYLEAAPVETERELPLVGFVNSTGRRVGDGKDNTKKIMADIEQAGGGINTAIWYCDGLEINNFNDWYLPSTDELLYMYNNLYLKGIGELKKANYWSSTFGVDRWQLSINFSHGEVNHSLDFFPEKLLVRAIRQF